MRGADALSDIASISAGLPITSIVLDGYDEDRVNAIMLTMEPKMT